MGESDFAELMDDELMRAHKMHGTFNTAHEASAVIREEFEEFWEEVRKKKENRDRVKMLTELVHVAAMCNRAALDLNLL